MQLYTHSIAEKLNDIISESENEYNLSLNNDNRIYIIRLDGVKMTKTFLGNKNKKSQFIDTMKDTLDIFMSDEADLKLAYSYSDEISIVLEKKILERYDYRIEKILSIFASKMTASFYIAAEKNNLNLEGKLRSFDARIVVIEDKDFMNYFLARQAFAITSYLTSLKNTYVPEERATSSIHIISLLSEAGIIYEEIPAEERFGLIWINDMIQESFEFAGNKKKFKYQLYNRDIYKPLPARRSFYKKNS